MAATLKPADVPQEVILRDDNYVLWANAINQGIYKLSLNARRVLYAALTTVRPSQERFALVTMPIGEVVRAFGLDDSHKSYDALRIACRQLMEAVIEIQNEKGAWDMRHWVERAMTSDDKKSLILKMSEEVRELVAGAILRDGFSVLMLYDIGKLTSDYAQRIYADVMEAAVHEGKHGNAASHWWLDLMFDDVRVRYGIGTTKYTGRYGTNNFRKFVIDGPIDEINEADMGIRIVPDYTKYRYRQRLIGVRLNVERVQRDEPRNVTPVTKTEIDRERMVAENPKTWERCLAQAGNEVRQIKMFADMERRERGSIDEQIRRSALDLLEAALKAGKRG